MFIKLTLFLIFKVPLKDFFISDILNWPSLVTWGHPLFLVFFFTDSKYIQHKVSRALYPWGRLGISKGYYCLRIVAKSSCPLKTFFLCLSYIGTYNIGEGGGLWWVPPPPQKKKKIQYTRKFQLPPKDKKRKQIKKFKIKNNQQQNKK